MVSMLNHRCLFIWQLVIYRFFLRVRDQKERRTERKETAIQMKKWKLYT